MIVYDIKLYDAKTDKVTIVISLPERRLDHSRARGRITIEKWAKSLLGEDGWLKNWHNISITQRSHNHRGETVAEARLYDHRGSAEWSKIRGAFGIRPYMI